MDNEREINSLVSENIALQWVLTQVLFRLGDLDPRVKGAIKSGFDDAAIGVRDSAIRSDKAASPPYLAQARRIIEDCGRQRLAMRIIRGPAFNLLLTKGRELLCPGTKADKARRQSSGISHTTSICSFRPAGWENG